MRTKNKTLATWLAFLGGSLGLHRLYLHGLKDTWAWAHPIPTALGFMGVDRVLTYGQDDPLSWVLMPLLGTMLAIGCLTGIVYALTDKAKWNARFNQASDATAGNTNWLTILGLALALMFGAVALMSTLAFSFQRYFEYQIEEGLKISR